MVHLESLKSHQPAAAHQVGRAPARVHAAPANAAAGPGRQPASVLGKRKRSPPADDAPSADEPMPAAAAICTPPPPSTTAPTTTPPRNCRPAWVRDPKLAPQVAAGGLAVAKGSGVTKKINRMHTPAGKAAAVDMAAWEAVAAAAAASAAAGRSSFSTPVKACRKVVGGGSPKSPRSDSVERNNGAGARACYGGRWS
jgi:hypothetical protein